MEPVYIISKNGKQLMPTIRYGHVRKMLKEGKAKIIGYQPFTVQLLYESREFVQGVPPQGDQEHKEKYYTYRRKNRRYRRIKTNQKNKNHKS